MNIFSTYLLISPPTQLHHLQKIEHNGLYPQINLPFIFTLNCNIFLSSIRPFFVTLIEKVNSLLIMILIAE